MVRYSILLVGFGISFFLVFQKNAPETDPAAAAPEEEKSDSFSNVATSLLKATVMMTGELEFSDLPFDENPATSRIIFLAFVFLITIVLLNLLNGMAVSDTQAIHSKAIFCLNIVANLIHSSQRWQLQLIIQKLNQN